MRVVILSKRDFGIQFDKDAEGDTIFRHRDGFRVMVS